MTEENLLEQLGGNLRSGKVRRLVVSIVKLNKDEKRSIYGQVRKWELV